MEDGMKLKWEKGREATKGQTRKTERMGNKERK